MENVEVKWRYQKNLDNGQKIKQTKNKANPKFYGVRAGARIRQRGRKLNSSAKATLEKFKDKSGNVAHNTNSMIAKHLRQCARMTYGISCRKSLAKWSSHSMRV